MLVVARLLLGLRVVELAAQVVAAVVERGVQILLGRGGDDLGPAGDPALEGDLLALGGAVLDRDLEFGGVRVEGRQPAVERGELLGDPDQVTLGEAGAHAQALTHGRRIGHSAHHHLLKSANSDSALLPGVPLPSNDRRSVLFRV